MGETAGVAKRGVALTLRGLQEATARRVNWIDFCPLQHHFCDRQVDCGLVAGTAKLKAAMRPRLVVVHSELRQAPLRQVVGQSMVVEGRRRLSSGGADASLRN